MVSLKKNSDFRRVYSKGKQYISPELVTYCIKNRNGFLRVGITSSKKIGCAVKRNRARRVIREAYRSIYHKINAENRGYDLIFIARGKTTRKKSTEIAVVMERHLKDAGFIR